MFDLDPMFVMSAMKGGLKPSRFLFSLEKRFLTSFIEMFFWVEKYANAEEAISARKTLVPGPSDKKEKEKEREKEKKKREEPSVQD